MPKDLWMFGTMNVVKEKESNYYQERKEGYVWETCTFRFYKG